MWDRRAGTSHHDQHIEGGDERTRTADPLLAKQVLYRLSYVPEASIIDAALSPSGVTWTGSRMASGAGSSGAGSAMA